MTREREQQTGSALIAVLCILTLVALLTASAVTVSQLHNHFSIVVSERGMSLYHAEGAAARIIWLLLADKKMNGTTDLWNFDYNEVDGERYIPDGTTKKFTYYGADAEAAISDMASGIDISGSNPTKHLKRPEDSFEEDTASYDEYLSFLDALQDYVDPDDFVRMHGAEKNEYEEMEKPHLPRNAKMQFREEVCFLPGLRKFFQPDEYGRMTAFQIIPQKKLKSIKSSGSKASFFGLTLSQLLKDRFKRDMANDILQARERWTKEGGRLSQILLEMLPPQVVNRVRSKYSFRGSGFYSFRVKVTPEKGKGSRILFFSMQLGYQPGEQKKLNYYDWMVL